MRFYPNSCGTDFGARVLEHNPCHDPKNGQFTFKGQGDCEPGDPSDKGRNRAIFGQMVPDEEGLAFNAKEAEKADAALSPTDSDSARAKAKDLIAKTLAVELMNHPGLEALANDDLIGSFPRRYEEETLSLPDPKGAVAQEGYARYVKDLKRSRPSDPNDPELKMDYDTYVSEFELSSAANAPSPEEAQEDYYEWVSEQEDKLRDEQYSDSVDEALRDFDREGDRAIAADESAYDEARLAARDRIRELRDELLPYGDVTEHPLLPGLEDVERSAVATALRYSQSDIIQQWEEHGDDAPFLHDREFLAAKLLTHTNPLPEFDRVQALEGTEYDPSNEELKQKYVDRYLEDYSYDYSSIASFDSWYKDEHGFDPDDYAMATKPEPFDVWYGARYAIQPEDYTPAGDPAPFEAWYEGQFGRKPSEYIPNPDADFQRRQALARNVASGLIEAWAASSSDHQTRSIALQVAADTYFKLGATYASTLAAGGHSYLIGRQAAERHAPILNTFLQAMHNDTQAWLKRKGVGTDGYVTLYRGWAARTEQEPGLKTVDTRNGSVVDVLLQPISSFSSNFNVARNFASSGGADTPLVMAVRVPVNRILGTARTGYGCLNESEFTVLGGRYPAYIQGYQWVTDPRGFLAGTLRWLKPRKGIEVGPGDRL